jgi:crotonobetainyl-CoA:carnitine CoA-transferase CaiB-like acyl-CoA transferase
MQREAPGALAGFRIVEACEGIGGPYAAMLLAEQGADVVKVESPRGDWLRGKPAYHALNRSKRAIVVDLDTAGGRAELVDLLTECDLFLYDWAAGRAEALGLGADRLRAINPRLIPGWLPPYGSAFDDATLPAEEALVQALAGVCDAQMRHEPRPVFINTPVTGYAQAIVGAIASAASLYAVARGAAPDRFEANAIAAIFAFETVSYIKSPVTPERPGPHSPRGPIPSYRLVQCSDGEWMFVGALTPPFWTKLAVAIGLEWTLTEERFAVAPIGFSNMEDRDALGALVDEAFRTKPREEWMRILEEADVPRAPVGTREEYARDPQTLHANMMIDVDDPKLGLTRQSNIPVWLRNSPGRVHGPAPHIGSANADAIVKNWRKERRAALDIPAAKRASPLEGVVVLDLGGFIAGANGSMMLSDLGADVIKIEPPGGDGWRAAGLAFFGSNRGKRGMCIDLRNPDARDVFLQLVDRADVVLDNARSGVMERLGIGWETLRARNPRIIHCSVTGYGPSGPYAHLPGFDPLMQARSGIMTAQGAPGEPVFLQVPVCDFMTALLAAYGIVCALVARERTGLGDRVETSLFNSAFAAQAGEFIFYEGRPPAAPGARDLAGPHALHRVYAAGDGNVMLACRTLHEAGHALSALGVTMPPGDPLAHPAEGELSLRIAAAVAKGQAAELVDALRALAVPAARCRPFRELLEDQRTADAGLWWDFEHPQWGRVRQTGAVIRWDDMSMRFPRRAPLLGEHSVEVLREFGIADSTIDALIATSALVQREAAVS